jgi:hypothetical protein
MKLINTDGLALIGPGSEWFWTAISGLILAVTFVAIYRQLRLQRSAAAIERVDALGRDWASDHMSRAKLEVLLAIQAKVSPRDIPELAATEIGDFWDRIAYLVRNGHVDRQLVHAALSRQVQQWWARLLPSTLAWRERDSTLEEWGGFEWLAGTMADMDTESGIPHRSDVEYLANHLDETVALMRRAVEIEDGRRTVPVRLEATTIPVMNVRLVSGSDGILGID